MNEVFDLSIMVSNPNKVLPEQVAKVLSDIGLADINVRLKNLSENAVIVKVGNHWFQRFDNETMRPLSRLTINHVRSNYRLRSITVHCSDEAHLDPKVWMGPNDVGISPRRILEKHDLFNWSSTLPEMGETVEIHFRTSEFDGEDTIELELLSTV